MSEGVVLSSWLPVAAGVSPRLLVLDALDCLKCDGGRRSLALLRIPPRTAGVLVVVCEAGGPRLDGAIGYRGRGQGSFYF